ncbi:MAG TPA: tetratricopeptide repeat protein [Polyangiaceae bacterium]
MSVRLVLGMTLVAGALLVRTARADAPAASAEPASALAASEACPSGDDTTCGRLQFEAGTRAFEQGQYEVARHAFESALSLRPHPVIRYNLALCWARLGKPSLALNELQLVLGDNKTDQDLRARSQRELRSAQLAQAHVTFTLSDPARERLELDGSDAPTSSSELALDPGQHHVRIISGASVVLDQDLELSPGERVELRVGQSSRRIDVVVVPEPAIGARAATPPPEPREAPRRGLSPIWFFAAAGTTAVLTGLTIWSGLDTQHALTSYQQQLPNLSQAEADRRVSEGHARERRTNLLLTGSLLGAAGSAVLGLWFVDFGGGQRAHVALGLGQVSVTTHF